MDQYTVVTLSIMGRRGKIYRVGDSVTADCFAEGHLEALLKDGAIKAVESTAPANEDQPPIDLGESLKNALGAVVSLDAAVPDASVDNVPRETSGDDSAAPEGDDAESEDESSESESESDGDGSSTPDIDAIGIRKIKKILKQKGVEFDPSASKEVLYGLLTAKYKE